VFSITDYIWILFTTSTGLLGTQRAKVIIEILAEAKLQGGLIHQ